MYKSDKFWLFATICFAIFTILYSITNGILSFAAILNFVMFIISSINLIMILNKNQKSKSDKK